MNAELMKPYKIPPAAAFSSSDVVALRKMLSEMRTELDRLHEISEEFHRARKHLGTQKADTKQLPSAVHANRVGRVLTISAIAEEVAKEFEVPLEYITFPRRYRRMVLVRQVLYLLASSLTGYSISEIARKCDMHHTTVFYGINRLKERMVRDPQLSDRVRALKDRLLGEQATPPVRYVRIADIVHAVASDFGIADEELIAKDRRHPGSLCRAICVFIAKHLKVASSVDMALYFGLSPEGGKNACYRLTTRMEKDVALVSRISKIERELAAISAAKEQTAC